MFTKRTPKESPSPRRLPDFSYLADSVIYMDTACQSLRPLPVIDAEREYYLQFNACGGRAKHTWGKRVDEHVDRVRSTLLAIAGKSAKDYTVAFTLNTTYGINLVLTQLPKGNLTSIVTSEIEHNSVLLPSIAFAKRCSITHNILKRDDDGTVLIDGADLSNSVTILNTLSNIDGRGLPNVKELATAVHGGGGLLLLDVAQALGHDLESLKGVDFDAAFGSAHKMYGPSLGFIIIRRSLLRQLAIGFLGGGTVKDVHGDTYELLSGEVDEHSVLEPGLQNWAGIVGFDAALRWLKDVRPMGKTPREYERMLSEHLLTRLKGFPRLHLLCDTTPRSVVSFWVDGLDAHELAIVLSEQSVMCRSGHFCCHHYLAHVRKLPPLLRVSLGLHTTIEDIDRFATILGRVLSAL